MGNIRAAVDALRPVANQARAAIELEQALDILLGLENHQEELVASIERMKDAQRLADADVAAAQAEVVNLCHSARSKADEILREAQVEAQKVSQRAYDEAQATIDNLVARTGSAEAALQAEIEKLAGLQDEVRALTSQRDSLVADLSELRAAIEKLSSAVR